MVVSARGTEGDRIRALELGADDYLVKPFSMGELVARVRAVVRRGVRAQSPDRGERIEIEELIIDPANVQAFVDGRSAELTLTEFRLLHALALERGRVVSREELMQRIWGAGSATVTAPSTSSCGSFVTRSTGNRPITPSSTRGTELATSSKPSQSKHMTQASKSVDGKAASLDAPRRRAGC